MGSWIRSTRRLKSGIPVNMLNMANLNNFSRSLCFRAIAEVMVKIGNFYKVSTHKLILRFMVPSLFNQSRPKQAFHILFIPSHKFASYVMMLSLLVFTPLSLKAGRIVLIRFPFVHRSLYSLNNSKMLPLIILKLRGFCSLP